MKTYFPALAAAFFLMVGGVLADNEIVFIDMQEVFKRFYRTQLAQDQIRQQADDIKIERDEMEVELEELKTEIEELRADSRDENLPEESRANKRDLLEEKLVELQKKEQEMVDFEKIRMEQIEAQNQRMTKKIFDEIREAVNKFAKMKDYAAVIDRSAQSRIGTEVILYTATKLDITTDVVNILNAGRKTQDFGNDTELDVSLEDAVDTGDAGNAGE